MYFKIAAEILKGGVEIWLSIRKTAAMLPVIKFLLNPANPELRDV